MPVILSILCGGVLAVGSAGMAGNLVTRRDALPWPVRYATGAAVYSLLVFLVLAVHGGFPVVFSLLGAGLGLAAYRFPVVPAGGSRMPTGWVVLPFLVVLGGYGAMYLVYALAPEIQPDAVAYHLRIVADYVRVHAFTHKSAFFDLLPQPVEMLFVPAFSVGAHSAAKLVHFSLLAAAAGLVREIALELGLLETVGWTASALFFLSPVVGLAGTSGYTDAGLAAACLSVVFLLIRWERIREPRLLVYAGIQAGMCYAVKPTFGLVGVLAFLFVAVRAVHWRPPASLAAVAAAFVAPWMVRSYLLAGNPLAPFFTIPGLDAELARNYSAFREGFQWRTAFWDYTVRGGNQGVLGPAFLLLPVALLGVRRRANRALLAVCMLLGLPVLANTGTRFLIPALGPAAIAIASVLPTPVAMVLVAVDAVASAPPLVGQYAVNEWRLGEFPWEAALRSEPERAFLARSIPGFAVTGLVERETPHGALILNLTAVPEAYLDRDFLGYWQSAPARRHTAELLAALESGGGEAGGSRRRDTAARMLGGGVAYILVSVTDGAFAPLGRDLLHHADQWGVTPLGVSGDRWLFRIGP
jgi:hypothetical protein